MAETMAMTTMAGELNQSASFPVSSITCRVPTHTTRSAKPMPSTGTLRVGVSRPAMFRQQRKAQIAPTGTLIKKIHGQLKLSEI